MNQKKFDFGIRTLQKAGYSYLLPIPVNWIKNMKLKKGSMLNIEMNHDLSLRIYPVSGARQDYTENGAVTIFSEKRATNE